MEEVEVTVRRSRTVAREDALRIDDKVYPGGLSYIKSTSIGLLGRNLHTFIIYFAALASAYSYIRLYVEKQFAYYSQTIIQTPHALSVHLRMS